MKLIPAVRYFKDAIREINKAKKRVVLVAIAVCESPSTHDFLEAIRLAAERGVRVTIAADVFSYTAASRTVLPHRRIGKGARQLKDAVATLKKAGATFEWLGVVRPTILHGRTHDKWLIVDNTAYTFGGINVEEKSASNMDFMFKLQHKQLADRLEFETGVLIKAESKPIPLPDVAYQFDKQVIMFDGGAIGRSMIYERAHELARDAKEILLVSQHCPTGRLARVITQRKSRVYFNRPALASSFNKPLIRLSTSLTGIRNRYKKASYIHAKFAIFTMADGSKVAITGSHNLTFAGVLLGTREIALETTDPDVIKQLEQFTEKYIA